MIILPFSAYQATILLEKIRIKAYVLTAIILYSNVSSDQTQEYPIMPGDVEECFEFPDSKNTDQYGEHFL